MNPYPQHPPIDPSRGYPNQGGYGTSQPHYETNMPYQPNQPVSPPYNNLQPNYPSHPMPNPSYGQGQGFNNPLLNPQPFTQPSPRVNPPQPMSQQDNTKRIDPKVLPNPTKSPQNFEKLVYDCNSFLPPPSAHSFYIARDNINCSPRFMRSTLNVIPPTKDHISKANLPLSLVVHPFAEVQSEENMIPMIDMGEDGPIRCRRCSAYINPHIKFKDNGHQYVCPFCRTMNEVPSFYFSPVDSSGKRRDIEERPELWKGSVDFLAPKDVEVQPSIGKPTIVFLIDVSEEATRNRLHEASINVIKQILDYHFKEDNNTRFGFVTFQKNIVHLWKINPKVEMTVLTQPEKAYHLPVDSYLTNYAENEEHIVSALDIIMSTFHKNRGTGNCFFDALDMVSSSFASEGLRIVCLLSSKPTEGTNVPKERTIMGKDSEKKLYESTSTKNAAQRIATSMTTVDIFLCSHHFSDLAQMYEYPANTCGQVNYYPSFSIDRHEEKLFFDLSRVLTRDSQRATISKLRTSEGISVDKYFGHFRECESDLECPTLDCDKAFVVDLKYDSKLDEKSEVVLQWATLYTNKYGLKLIRVHTMALKVSQVLASTFKSADVDALLYVLTRRCIDNLPKKNLTEIRTDLTQRITVPLAYYRKHCAKNSAYGQLVLPDSLKFLPIYALALIKHPILSNHNTLLQNAISEVDTRNYYRSLLRTMSLEFFIPMIFPRLFALHKVLDLMHERYAKENDETQEDSDSEDTKAIPGDEDFYGTYWLPKSLALTQRVLEPSGVYLMDTNECIYIAFQAPVNQDLYSRLFNEDERIYHNPEDEFNVRVHNIIATLRNRRPLYQPTVPIQLQDNSTETLTFRNYLIEDGQEDYRNKELISVLNKFSYTAYLCHVHQNIQDSL